MKVKRAIFCPLPGTGGRIGDAAGSCRNPSTLADLLREIRDAYPDLAPPDVEIVAAVNEEYAEGGV